MLDMCNMIVMKKFCVDELNFRFFIFKAPKVFSESS